MDEAALEFAAENRGDSKRSQIVGVHRRIQTVAAEMRVRILLAQRRDELRGEARGGVHREIQRNQARAADGLLIERLASQIEAGNAVTALTQPCCRRDHAKRLATEFVRRDQHDLHAGTVYSWGEATSRVGSLEEIQDIE